MTYNCRYKANSIFPYPRKIKTKHKKNQQNSPNTTYASTPFHSFFSGPFNAFLTPVETLLGRKIAFDDLLLVGIIYLLFTEKENKDTTLLLCLIFILIG